MSLVGHVLRRVSPICCALSVLSFALAVPALADSATATASITAGSLTEVASSTPSFSATLNGTDQSVTSNAMTLAAKDRRGSGAGWNLTITSTQFTTGGGSAQTLSTSATTVTAVSSVCAGGGTCTNPTNSIAYPLTVPAGSTAPTAVKLFNSAVNSGLGDFTLTPNFSLAVPANAYAGSYSSTMTFSMVSAP
jgi:hypothetical protein